MACAMALSDALDGNDALQLPGVHGVLAWTADDPAQLPKGIAQVLSPQNVRVLAGSLFRSQREPSRRSVLGSNGDVLI